MSKVKVRNKEGSSIFDEIAGLSSFECMRDAKIVCEDGILRWSALLLSQWSDIARLKLSQQGDVCPQQPLTVIIPHVKMEMMKKILTWTVQGQVAVNALEALEISTLLFSLRANIKFSQEPCYPGELNTEQNSRNQASARDENFFPKTSKLLKEKDVFEPKKSNFGNKKDKRVESKSFTVARNETPDQEYLETKNPESIGTEHLDGIVVKMVKCPLCTQTMARANLVSHICTIHFKTELIKLWGHSDSSKLCEICGKLLKPTKRNCFSRSICRHIGLYHGYLFRLPNVDPKVQQVLKEDTRFPFKKKSVSDSNTRKLFPGCRVCQEGKMDLKTMILHVTQIHYARFFLPGCDSLRKVCKFCDRPFSDEGGISYSFIQHVMKTHHDRLDKVLPAELKERVRQASREQLFLPKEKSSQLLLDRGTSFSCPISSSCLSTFKEARSVKRHLCERHYKDKLLKLGKSDNGKSCGICGYIPSHHVGKQRNLGDIMAAHIGLVHNRLLKVLPQKFLKLEEGLAFLKSKKPAGDCDYDDFLKAKFRKEILEKSSREKLDTYEDRDNNCQRINPVDNKRKALQRSDEKGNTEGTPTQLVSGLLEQRNKYKCHIHACPKTYKDIWSLKRHLCQWHYKDQLLDRWNSGNSISCQICGYCPTENSHQTNSPSTMATHIGMTHGKLQHFLASSIEKETIAKNADLREQEPADRQVKEKSTTQPKQEIKKVGENQDQSRDQIKNTPTPPQPNKPDQEERKGRSPTGDQPVMERKTSDNFPSTLPPEHEDDPPSTPALSSHLSENDLSACCLNFKYPKSLKRHICRCHYLDQLLELGSTTDAKFCRLCEHVPRADLSAKLKRIDLAEHIGLEHNGIDQIAPQKFLDRLAGLKANDKQDETTEQPKAKRKKRKSRVSKDKRKILSENEEAATEDQPFFVKSLTDAGPSDQVHIHHQLEKSASENIDAKDRSLSDVENQSDGEEYEATDFDTFDTVDLRSEYEPSRKARKLSTSDAEGDPTGQNSRGNKGMDDVIDLTDE